VNLFAYLAKYSPEGKSAFSMELNENAMIEDLMEHLGIPSEESRTILVNGRHCKENKVLKEGDEVVLMTPVEGG